MGVIHINHKGEEERAPFVHAWMKEMFRDKVDDSREHAFIGGDGESKVEEVRRVGEAGYHSRGKVEFSQILW
jgi:hypothetical protein